MLKEAYIFPVFWQENWKRKKVYQVGIFFRYLYFHSEKFIINKDDKRRLSELEKYIIIFGRACEEKQVKLPSTFL